MSSRDVKMMQTPSDWPYWPWLPLKRVKDGFMEVGLLVEAKDTPLTTVLISNLHASLAEKRNADRIEYASADAIVADGWLVD